MGETIFTLHEFMLQTETITYVIVAISFFAILFFWLFLTKLDDE
jgi:hypothetical protein